MTGAAAQALDSQDASAKAEAIVGLTTFALILLLMVVIFRSVILALFPLLVIGLVSQVAVGLIGAANKVFDLKTDSSIQVILIVVLFGIGTDYILFFLFRYRERLRLGEDRKDAVVQAVARAGEAIASAGGAVIVSFMALVLSSLGIFKSIGPALAIAVAVTVRRGADAGAGGGLPGRDEGLLAVEGLAEGAEVRPLRRDRRLARPPPGGVRRGVRPGPRRAGGLRPRLQPELRPRRLGRPEDRRVRGRAEDAARRASRPGRPTRRSCCCTPPTARRSTRPRPRRTPPQLGKAEGVGQVAPAQLSPDKQTASFSVVLDTDPTSDAALAAVKGPIRDAAHAAAPDGTEALVGGTTSVFVDFQKAMNRDYKVVFPVAAIVIMIILALLLRSLVAPWYLMASVGLGFGATLGAAVIVFQTSRARRA